MLISILFCFRFFKTVYSSFYKRSFYFDSFAKVLVQIQHYTFLPILCFSRYVLYKDSFAHLLWHPETALRWLEFAGMGIFWTYFITMLSLIPDPALRIFFFFLPSALMIILQLQLFISHSSMPCDEMGTFEDFVTYQLRTTLDFYCPEALDPMHGGLQFQVAHHFFPRLPRPNLRKATEIVVEFCREHNLEYHFYTFTSGNVKLLGHLKAIAHEAKYLAQTASLHISADLKSFEQEKLSCRPNTRRPHSS